MWGRSKRKKGVGADGTLESQTGEPTKEPRAGRVMEGKGQPEAPIRKENEKIWKSSISRRGAPCKITSGKNRHGQTPWGKKKNHGGLTIALAKFQKKNVVKKTRRGTRHTAPQSLGEK